MKGRKQRGSAPTLRFCMILAALTATICIQSAAIYAGSADTAAEATEVKINEANFPDKVFRNHVQKYDADKDGNLSSEELGNVLEIDVSSDGVIDLKGIEYFTELQ